MQVEFGDRYLRQYGRKYLNIHRADLQTILSEQVQKLANCRAYLNCKVKTVQNSPSGIKAISENGQEFQGDLLIAADGIRSTIKSQLFPSHTPTFSGHLAWRALIPSMNLPEHLRQERVMNFVGAGKHIVTYPVKNGEYINFVGVVESSSKAKQSWVEHGKWQDLANDFKNPNQDARSLIEAVPKTQCYRWGLYDHPPLKTWYQDRVVMLGDAAHASLPYMAAGASLAIEDARILQRCIEQYKDIETALYSYQRARQARTQQVQKRSRATGKIYHLKSDLLRKLTFRAIKLAIPTPNKLIADYNANSEAI
jgi:salicylate hydroxylase